MKKKKYLLLFGLLIPLLFTIGFSSWIIMYSFEFSPQYESSSISKFFDYENVTTYNGEGQLPSPKPGVTISGNIQYDYKLESSNTFITDGSKPVNAGTYDVKITITDSEINGTCQVKFRINKKKVKLNLSTLNINYGECGRDWSNMFTYIKSKIIFLDENNQSLSDFSLGNQCKLDGMHNGYYYYGVSGYKIEGLTTTTNIAGSTYVAEFTMFDDTSVNYEFASSNKLIIKYKTAIINGTYYTIEDAIKNQGGKITFAGDSSKNNTYVETVFCCLTDAQGNPYKKSEGYFTEDLVNYKDKKVFTLSTGTLLVPYNNSTNVTEKLESDSATSYVYSCLTIPNNFALVVKSGAELQIGGVLANRGITGMHGVIMNYGIITVESSSYIYSYGFLKGTGLINMKNGSVAYDIMRMFDWPGGTAASGMADDAFPVIAWSMHNISCPMKIYKGAKLCGYSSFTVTLLGYQKPDFCIVGASASEKACLFKPSSSSVATDYILKKGESNNDSINKSITESNQTMGQRDIVEIHGDYQDAAMSVGISFYKFTTSTKICVPIAYMDIVISKDSSLLIENSSYVFMLGTSLTIEYGATVNVSGNAFVAFDKMTDGTAGSAVINPWFATIYCRNVQNAKLIVNGSLIGTGYAGGVVSCENNNAQISLQHFSISAITMKNNADGSESRLTEPYLLYGDIGDSSSFEYNSFTSGTVYISTTIDSLDYYFTAATNVKTFILEFYDENKTTLLDQRKIQVLLPNDEGEYIYVLTGSEFIPEKLHYDFSEWYFISNNNLASGTTLVYNSNDSSANTYKFYASWVEHEYTILYSAGYEDPDTGEVIPLELIEITLSDVITTFTLKDFNDSPLKITTKAVFNDYFFNGWYLGIDDSSGIKLSELSKSNIELFVETFGTNTPITLYCQFSSNVLYTIIFNDNLQDVEIPSVELSVDDFIPLPDNITIDYDNRESYPYYLYGWYLTNEPTIESTLKYNGVSISSILRLIDVPDNNIITLTALWVEKNRVEYYSEDGTLNNNLTQYYIPGDSITLQPSTVMTKNDGKITEENDPNKSYHAKYQLSNWIVFDSSSGTYELGETVEFSSKIVKLKPSFVIYYEYCEITLDISNATVTIGNTSYTSDKTFTLERGSSYVVSYTYTEQKDQKFTIGGSNHTSGQSYTFNYDVTIVASSSGCLTSGTLITLADGSIKKVEDLTLNDLLLVYNHETGKFEASPIVFIDDDGWKEYDIVNLKFSNGTITRLIYEHGYFDVTLNKYVYVDEYNYRDFIGHQFVYTNGDKLENVTLVDSYITTEYVGCYSPVTAVHLNYIVDGMLSMPGGIEGIFNIFEYDDNLMFDEELMKADIEKYGIMEYEVLAPYVPYEMYIAFNAKYFNVAIGKGYITFDEILYYAEKYLDRHGLRE